MTDRKPSDLYAPDNLRFRKALIRERLADLKTEREALLEEREAISRKLGSSTRSDGTATITRLNAELDSAKRGRFGFRA